ncbi:MULTISPECIES: hypothetical protein [unclassified Microbacterium]|uniref:hypothetical protein n=1 Tax=unclassified Microbacterium TaxID=2609290 RepID=UPI00214B65DF|nr:MULTISPECIES: hypothetical protein [unclassified Microbacterium]MCR2810959.1 hypothetical protein [Microbacterium sp. zg.B185]WIM19642.1 hypothetical protein QNO12_02210 [Microbacterium sp. zg-B185]
METREDPAGGLMVLALWVERNGVVRVRISKSMSPLLEDPEPTYASTKTKVLREVEAWLNAFVTPV